MTNSNQQRPYFCLCAFPEDERYFSNIMANVSFQLNEALREPFRAEERERAAESIIRNNGLDASHDRAFHEAGIKGGRAEAIRQIRQAYLAAVPDILKHMETDLQFNKAEYTASALLQRSSTEKGFLGHAIDSLKRAHLEKDVEFLISDDAWREAGIDGVAHFQSTVRKMFIDHGVGGYVMNELDLHSSDGVQVRDLSEKTADFAIRLAFPELADKLEIPKDIKEELVPKPSAAAGAFIQATDFNPA